MSSHAAVPLIDADRDRSNASGVKSTPTFFIGDKKIEGAAPLSAFRLIIDTALVKARRVR
jgi:protein-disulfide isomerase